MRVLGWFLAVSAGCVASGGEGADTSDTGPGSLTDTGPVACTDLDLRVDVGTGETAYAPLSAGDDVTMVHGAQGGWHVEVAGVVHDARVTVSIRPSVVLDGGLVLAGDQPLEYHALAGFDEASCSGQFWGRRAFLDEPANVDQAYICSLDGAGATLAVEVGDPQDGRLVEAALPVTLRVSDADLPLCAAP